MSAIQLCARADPAFSGLVPLPVLQDVCRGLLVSASTSQLEQLVAPFVRVHDQQSLVEYRQFLISLREEPQPDGAAADDRGSVQGLHVTRGPLTHNWTALFYKERSN